MLGYRHLTELPLPNLFDNFELVVYLVVVGVPYSILFLGPRGEIIISRFSIRVRAFQRLQHLLLDTIRLSEQWFSWLMAAHQGGCARIGPCMVPFFGSPQQRLAPLIIHSKGWRGDFVHAILSVISARLLLEESILVVLVIVIPWVGDIGVWVGSVGDLCG